MVYYVKGWQGVVKGSSHKARREEDIYQSLLR